MRVKLIQLLLFTLLSFSLPAQVIELELLEEHTVSELEALANSLNVFPGIIEYNYGVRVYKLIYETIDAHGLPTRASGALIVPVESHCGLALASYQHGTAAHKDNVPSRLSGEVNVGLLYATNGMVMCMPDYLGLGDSPGFHPYVHARSEATAVIDMLRTARVLADSLDYTLNDELFLFGYSQGGHATAAAHRMIEEELATEFTVTASAPMSGPYDASGVQAEVITSDLPYPTPNYLPYIIFAYQSVYGNIYNHPSEIFLSPYDSLLPTLFDGMHSGGEIDAYLPDIPNRILRPEALDSFRTDPANRLRRLLEDNDVYDWSPQAPLKLIYCRDDDQVIYRNSLVAYDRFLANGAEAVEIQDIGPGLDHNGCASFAFLSGLVYFKQFLTVRNGLEIVSAEVQGSSGNNGSIVVEATGGNGLLQYNWSNMVNSDSLGGLAPGSYSLTVSDESGCTTEETFTVEQLTATYTAQEGKQIKVYPNPATRQFFVEWPAGAGESRLILRNMEGIPVHSLENIRNPKVELNPDLVPGIYIIEIRQAYNLYTEKVVIHP